MADFKVSEVKSINIGDKVFKIKTKEDEIHLKGYIYDSLTYRYIRAREKMAEYEYKENIKSPHYLDRDREWYYRQAKRDIIKFCQILDEAIGEHD